jgi:tetratricopeptide (TPR) repeat protein
MMKRAEANEPTSIIYLASHYQHGKGGLQQDGERAIKLYTRAAELGTHEAHYHLGHIYDERGDLKKAKFHYEAAAMTGHELARGELGVMEAKSGNMEQAVKHWKIAASAGSFYAMHEMRVGFEKGYVNLESINSTLVAYNNSCAEMRSEARDAYMRRFY